MRTNKQIASAMKVTQALVFSALALGAYAGDFRVAAEGGRVESLAKVEVNGKDFGDVWSQPYRIPLTGAVKAGKNTLKVSVTDTWYNRLVFDAGQPEAKRRTWTIAGPKKGSALRDSGLIGPVKVVVVRFK